MNKLMKCLLSTLIVLPCVASAVPVGSMISEGVILANKSSQAVLVTDPAAPILQNYYLAPGATYTPTYTPVQFNIAGGQTFSHTININSAGDFSPICTIVTNMVLSANGFDLTRPSSTNPARCQAGSFMQGSNGNMTYGFKIVVA